MTAMQTSLQALRPGLDIGDASIDGPAFDPVRHEWQLRATFQHGATPTTLLISLNESTGMVCAHDPAADRCRAVGNAADVLRQARDRRAALDDAMAHPPPDLQGVMVALIRYQLAAKDGYLHANRMPLYVGLSWPEGTSHLDLSSDAMHSLADAGLALFPGSAWKTPKGQAVEGSTMVMNVGLPMRRPDGDYDVQYNFYCGSLCASWHMAVMRYDAHGWHVVSSQMQAIS
jgi:hypothetical protein